MPTNLRSDCAIIVPSFQAAKSLPQLLDALCEIVDSSRIAVIDDGSTDGSEALVQAKKITCLRHSQNLGKGSALATGLQWARRGGYTWAISLDADGQHDVSEIFKFAESKVDDVTGLVVGARPVAKTQMPWHRRLSNVLSTSMITFLAGQPVHDAQSGFRMYRSEIIDRASIPKRGRFEWEAQVLVLISHLGYKIQSVPIKTLYGKHGSHMRIFADTFRFCAMYWRLAWIG